MINNNEKGKAGHAWIVDGISRRTRYLRLRIYEQMIVDQKLFDVFYHFNWGWAGKCNGFFFSDSYQFVVDNADRKDKDEVTHVGHVISPEIKYSLIRRPN